MINKLAPVQQTEDQQVEIHRRTQSRTELLRNQQEMEEKVYQIWTVLSAFEESSAACISDMLLHVSNGAYVEGVQMAERFIIHVEVLFGAIDDLGLQYREVDHDGTLKCADGSQNAPKFMQYTAFHYTKAAKMLCKKTINFFSLLSHTQETGTRQLGITQELLSLVTGLAHYLKILIRIALTGALRLERDYASHRAIPRFLSKLMLLANHEGAGKQKVSSSQDFDPEVTSDLCQTCKVTLEESCLILLNVMDESANNNMENTVLPSEDHVKSPPSADNTPPFLKPESRSKSYHGEKPYEAIHLADIKRMKSTHMDRKLSQSYRFAKRSTLVQSSNAGDSRVAMVADGSANANEDGQVEEVSMRLAQMKGLGKEDAITLDDITQVAAKHPSSRRKAPAKSKAYLAELSALEYFIVKHIAVLQMEQLVKEHFVLEELLDLIEMKKSGLWGKFVTSLKTGNKKNAKPRVEGTFGVSLEALVERNSVESNLGAGPSTIRIPSFIDDVIAAMKQMDMSVEGIFRKNGNIRRLKELSEAIDKNPQVDLSSENAVQLAALLKKFLRELPDPLLTFKLHRLFVTSQKLESESDRLRLLHLTCCLLPKCHRDTTEVLFLFLKWVASFAFTDADNGSKMDLQNLATIMAPNILYSRGKDPSKDESFAAIQAVHSLLKYQEDFCTIPDDIANMLNDPSFIFNADLTSKDILKRYENIMKIKKSHSAGDILSDLPEETPPPLPSSPPAAGMHHGDRGKTREWADEFKANNSKAYYTYRKAHDSVKKCPLDLNHPIETAPLLGVGPRIVEKLEKKLKEHCTKNGLPMPEKPMTSNKAKKVIQASSQGSALRKPNSSACSPPPAKRQRTSVYVPRYRSGAYAIMLALLAEERLNGEGGMTRQEIIRNAQPLCDASFNMPENGRSYTAWSSLKTLVEKEYVNTNGHPALYFLTAAGRKVAEQLLKASGGDVPPSTASSSASQSLSQEIASERQSSMTSTSSFSVHQSFERIRTNTTSQETHVASAFEDREDECTELEPSPSQTSQAPPSFAPFSPILFSPGTFEVVLLLDNREIRHQKDRDYIGTQLLLKGISVIVRPLPVGDVMWIARLKSCGGPHEELVLNHIVERKTGEDLMASIKDGRFLEQKFRLKRSGLEQCIYLIEERNFEESVSYGLQAINTAISSTQVIDGFFLKRTANLDESIEYLARLTRFFVNLYVPQTLYAIPPRLIDRTTYLDFQAHLRNTYPDRPHLIDFGTFSALCNKSSTLTLHDMFIRMLRTIRGVSAEKALEIIKTYPTPMQLLQAYGAAKDTQEQKSLLHKATMDAVPRRKVGPTLSERIWEVWYTYY
ncbi:hypothetical protein BZG36_04809 [Bifiguratus adelaidae]|uniref:Crossover junction endonuclease MUS81 n=1 Tax=Bifiguratus adelaidae TaxID=1938954 RepID=A0A261XTX0_9FUNG|nr:hypothetical protein BZG36_04809 [Bifiguratus adelaidae]